MYNPQEILTLLNNKTLPEPKLKEVWVDTSLHFSFHSKGIRPDYKKLTTTGATVNVKSKNWSEEYKSILEDRILVRHPREESLAWEWRKSVIPTINSDTINRATGQLISAIFQETNYNIFCDREVTQEYITGKNFKGHTLVDWFRIIGFNFFRDDPNGLVFVNVGYGVSGQQINAPVLELISSKEIDYKSDELLVFTKNKIKHVVSKDFYMTLLDDKGTYKIDENYYYQHNLGVLPIVSGIGIYQTDGFFKSIFDSFLSWGDLFVRNFTDHELLLKNFSYPHKQILEMACNKCSGTGEIDDCKDGDCKPVTCKSCSGKGTISINPGEVFVSPAPTSPDDLRDYKLPEAVKFINPDIEVLKESRINLDQVFKDTESSLYIYKKESTLQESGVSIKHQKESFYNFCKFASDSIFEFLRNTIKLIGAFQGVKVINNQVSYDFDFTINIDEPSSFETKSIDDLQDNYSKAFQSGSNTIIRHQAEVDYVSKAYHDKPVLIKKIQIKKLYNKLDNYTLDELVKMRAIGGLTEVDFLINANIDNAIELVIYDKGEQWFLQSDYSEIKQLLDQKIITQPQ